MGDSFKAFHLFSISVSEIYIDFLAKKWEQQVGFELLTVYAIQIKIKCLLLSLFA